MPHHYCTYFDHRYLPRGIALMESMLAYDRSAQFHVLALDESCADILRRMAIANISVVTLAELEAADPELLAVKPSRTLVEYYFTVTPCLPRYLLNRYGAEIGMITYLDADLWFFADPEIVHREIGNASIAITPHRFSPERQGLKRFGLYNVGWVGWRNDAEGRRCLEDYRRDCLAWCYDKLEADRFADQKYLDAWPQRYAGVRSLEHPGINAAAWNVNNHHLSDVDGLLMLGDRRLVFWHYHALREQPDGRWNHSIDDATRLRHPLLLDRIYTPYIMRLKAIDQKLQEKFGLQRNITSIRYENKVPAVPAAPAEAAKPFNGWRQLGPAWPAQADTGWDDGRLAEIRRQQWTQLTALPDHALAGGHLLEQTNILIALEAVLAAAGPDKRLSVLDWGGEVGSFQYRLSRLHPGLALDYTVKEMAPLCALGRSLNPAVRFVESAEEALAGRYGLVMASAAIHYDADWRRILAGLARATAGRLLIARQPTVTQAPSSVVEQGAYGTVFRCWVLNEQELLQAFSAAGLRLERRMVSGDSAQVAGAAEQPVFRSYLLAPA
jgi:putative methyltransferase (TIGR04325 family)